MRIEVNSAADFLMNLLRVRKANQLSENQLLHFKGSLEQILTRHFQRHWYPDVPNKGSGFRCLRINGKMDPIIEKAGHAAGLNAVALRKLLPLELTIWIDPDEVSYRIGENGTICVLYDIAQSRASPTSDLDSTGSSSGIACDEYIMERVGRLDLSVSSDSGTGSMVVDYLDHSTSTSSNQPPNGGSATAAAATTPAVPVATTGGKQHQQQQHHKYNHSNNNNNNHHHYAKQRHSNSMSSSSSGQTSPPLSPPYGGGYPSHQQQPQQPPSARYHNQHNNNSNSNNSSNYYSSSVHQQQQPYFHWGEYANNKVRTQC